MLTKVGDMLTVRGYASGDLLTGRGYADKVRGFADRQGILPNPFFFFQIHLQINKK